MPKGISHRKENEKEKFVYVQKEAALPTAAAAAVAAAAVENHEEKMPKARSNMYVYSSTRIFGLSFENEKTVQPESTRATRKTYLTSIHYSAIDANTTYVFHLIFVHVTFLRVLYNIQHHISFAEELEKK